MGMLSGEKGILTDRGRFCRAGLGAIAFAFVLASAGIVLAGPFEDGDAAFLRGEYEIALRLWRPLAESGDAKAQHLVARLYANGQGVTRDRTEALKWYRKAAEQGDAEAQFDLSVIYDDGLGIPRDFTEAVKWYRRAADQGQALAMSNLGVMYQLGQGIARDPVQALKWFMLSASHHSPGRDRDLARRSRDQTAGKMTTDQIAEAERLARDWRPKAEKP